MTEQQFLSVANTFDILLFKTNTAPGKLIRAYTGGEFDHAAMILKLDQNPDQVFYLESTSDKGVIISAYDQISPLIGNLITKVAIRRLEIDHQRRENSLNVIDQFLDEALGRQYEFSLKKLWSHSSAVTLP